MRQHTGYRAFMLHRLSGLALALFVPLHFLALALAIEGEARLETMIRWTDQGAVKLAEWGLVVLLGVHLMLGLRLLAIEMLPWRGALKRAVPIGLAAAFAVGAAFWIAVS